MALAVQILFVFSVLAPAAVPVGVAELGQDGRGASTARLQLHWRAGVGVGQLWFTEDPWWASWADSDCTLTLYHRRTH
jgi:hypothetical protein